MKNLIRWRLLLLLPLLFLTGCRWGCLIHEHRVWPISPVENETISGQVEIIWGYYYRWGCYFGECPSPETYATYDEKWHNLDSGEWGIIAAGKPISQSSMWDTTQVPEGRYEIWIYTHNYDAECNPWTLWDISNYVTVNVEKKCKITVSLDPSEVRPTGSGTPNITTVIVKTTDHQGNPIPDVSVTLEAEAVQYSGGHQHNSSRKVGSFNPPTGTTDANGEFRSRYTASAFGGEEIIIAKVEECEPKEERASLTVRVPGLITLGSGANFILTGSTPAHPDNHHGTSTINSALETIANDYADSFPGFQLVYNDMSLVYGGLFDIGPRPGHPGWQLWHTPHSKHRTGRNVDLGLVSIGRQNTLRRIIQRNKGSIYPEGDHWHLTF